MIEEADRAGKQYRYSLRHLGAKTEEEKIAATLALTAYQKFQSGDYDDAGNTFKRAAQLAPNFPSVYRNWATVESEAGFYEKADELMQKATSLDPSDSKLWFVWGNIEKRRQRYDRAFDYLEKAAKLSPNEAPIVGALGDVEKRRGNYEEADHLLRKSLQISSSITSGRHEIIGCSATADNLRRWASAILKDRRPKEALDKLKEAHKLSLQAFELDKDDLRARNTYLEVSKDLAILLLKEEDLDKAEVYFKSAITQKPVRAKERKNNEVACLYYAKGLLSIGKKEDAKKYFNLGKKSLFHDSSFLKQYRDLGEQLSETRTQGKLFRVVGQKGYGFISLLDETEETVFLHRSKLEEDITNEEFEKLEGSILSFILKKNEKGLYAEKAQIV